MELIPSVTLLKMLSHIGYTEIQKKILRHGGNECGEIDMREQKKQKHITHVLLIVFALLVFIGEIMGLLQLVNYHKVRKLCAEIKEGKEIHTKISDGTTHPVFTNILFTIIQTEGVKIPLVEACLYGNLQAVETLLKNGADPNFYFDGYWSPMEANVNSCQNRENRFEIMKLLVEYGADVDGYASYDPAIFDLVKRFVFGRNDPDEEEMILWLLDHNAKRTEESGNNILYYAVRGNSPDFVQTLIEDYNFDVNEKGNYGRTPLCSAISLCSIPYSNETVVLKIVQVLLTNGADVSILDENGKVALDYAVERGFTEVAALLEK